MSLKDYLATLEPGHQVYVRWSMGGWAYGSPYEVQTVQKLTATQIVTEDYRFNRTTGRQVGRCKRYIVEATDSVRSQHENKTLQAAVEAAWRDIGGEQGLDPDLLKEVLETLRKAQKRRKEKEAL